MRVIAMSIVLSALAIGPTKANHYMQNADPGVVGAFQQLLQVYGSACQSGNGQACTVYRALDQEAAATLNAGYNCQMGDQQACSYYQYAVGQLQMAYAQTQQALAAAQQSGGGMGLSHEQRMQQIQAWGAQRNQAFQQRMQRMDQNHQSFIEMIRQ